MRSTPKRPEAVYSPFGHRPTLHLRPRPLPEFGQIYPCQGQQFVTNNIHKTGMRKLWNRLRKIDANRSTALAAVFISLCALYVSVQEMRLMREQQRVSVYPHLSFSRSYSGDGFSIYLKNSGTGLARINSVQLTNGEQYFENWLEVSAHYMPEGKAFGYDRIFTSTINGEVLTPGESARLLFLKWDADIRKFEQDIRELKMRICYSSLLDEHWILENDDRQESKQACTPIPEREFY